MIKVYDISLFESKDYYPIVLIPNGLKVYVKEYIDSQKINQNNTINKKNVLENENKLRIATALHYKINIPTKPVFPAEPIKPKPPQNFKYIKTKETKFGSKMGCSGYMILLFIIIFISVQIGITNVVMGYGIFVLLTIGSLGFIYNFFSEEYEIDKKIELSASEMQEINMLYQQQLYEYNWKLKIYNLYSLTEESIKEKMERYERQLEYYNTYLESKIIDYIIYKSQDTYRIIDEPYRTNENILKGKAEDMFLVNYLLKYFKDKIQINMSVGQRNPFYPDYVFKDSNLYIDIEIDEPFESINKKPIHEINGGDEIRNEYFINKNWFVVRFAESQIINYPNECCNFLNNLIYNIQTISNTKPLRNVVPEIKRWTYEEAYIKAEKIS